MLISIDFMKCVVAVGGVTIQLTKMNVFFLKTGIDGMFIDWIDALVALRLLSPRVPFPAVIKGVEQTPTSKERPLREKKNEMNRLNYDKGPEFFRGFKSGAFIMMGEIFSRYDWITKRERGEESGHIAGHAD